MIKKFEHFTGMRNISYSGIILNNKSKNKLLNIINNIFSIPEDWSIYAHHMTICLGELPTIYRDYREEEIELIVTHYGLNDKSLAVKVDGFFTLSRCKDEINNRIPHITISTSPGTSPKESNNIKNWIKIKPFKIKGKIMEIHNIE